MKGGLKGWERDYFEPHTVRKVSTGKPPDKPVTKTMLYPYFLFTLNKMRASHFRQATKVRNPSATPMVPTQGLTADLRIGRLLERVTYADKITNIANHCITSNVKTAFQS